MKKTATKNAELVCNCQFCSKILPVVPCWFGKKWEAGVWNQGIFRILLCVLWTPYVKLYSKLQYTEFFPAQLQEYTIKLCPKQSTDPHRDDIIWSKDICGHDGKCGVRFISSFGSYSDLYEEHQIDTFFWWNFHQLLIWLIFKGSWRNQNNCASEFGW